MALAVLLLSILLLSVALSWWLSDIYVASRSLRVLIGSMVSVVIHSLLFDLSVVLNFSFIVSCGAVVVFSLMMFRLLFRERGLPQFRFPIFTFSSVLAVGLIYYLSTQFIPHSGRWGRWDARAIWTMHASFLYHQEHWRNLFDPAIAWTHADYPLMLSSLVAMFWRALGFQEALVPCIIAYCVLLFTNAAVYTALSKTNRMAALLALGALALTPLYAKIAAYQGADSLVGLFILVTLILSVLSDDSSNGRLVFLTGWFCGFAGWTKNEGVVFTMVFSLILLWRYRKSGVNLVYYILGLLLPVIVILIFKLCFAPHNDIVSGQGAQTVQRLLDLSRHCITLRFFFENAVSNYWVLLMLAGLILLRGYTRLYSYQLLALVGMVVAYYLTFILTPRDLAWHLETASLRLFIQLLPGFIFVLIYAAVRRREVL